MKPDLTVWASLVVENSFVEGVHILNYNLVLAGRVQVFEIKQNLLLELLIVRAVVESLHFLLKVSQTRGLKPAYTATKSLNKLRRRSSSQQTLLGSFV